MLDHTSSFAGGGDSTPLMSVDENIGIGGDTLNPRALFSSRVSSSALTEETIQIDRTLNGTIGNDKLRGGGGNERILGQDGNDKLRGKRGEDWLLGGKGRDIVDGGIGDDLLYGGEGRDVLRGGGSGDDLLYGGIGKDLLSGGRGADRFRIGLGDGGSKIREADTILDFNKRGQEEGDRIQLDGIRFVDLDISQGIGKHMGRNTLIQHRLTGEFLAIIKNTSRHTIDINDFTGDQLLSGIDENADEVIPPSSGESEESDRTPVTTLPSNQLSSISQPKLATRFDNPIDLSREGEDQLKAAGAPTITVGDRSYYIGYQQVSRTNQNSVIVSFDPNNPANNWARTDYETGTPDSRGYGLYWNGSDLYAVFSIDGGASNINETFQRASNDNTTRWIRSYGRGGGAKVAVVAQIDPETGKMTDAAYLSAVLENGRSNTLIVDKITTSPGGDINVRTQSRFYPRKLDGSPMLDIGDTPAPFSYTVGLSSDLSEVKYTKAKGIQ